MASLTAEAVLRLADAGPGLPAPERALLAIAAAEPERAPAELRALTVGESERRLIAMHEDTFGPELEGFAECPACGEGVSVRIEAAELLDGAPPPTATGPETIDRDGISVTFRLPTAGDLGEVAMRASDVESAREALVELCVTEAHRDGRPCTPRDLPEPLLDEIADRIAAGDPAAELRVGLECPACAHEWALTLDAGAFLWRKLDALARRLAEEVHVLACAYGWSEHEILALPAARRERYMELTGA